VTSYRSIPEEPRGLDKLLRKEEHSIMTSHGIPIEEVRAYSGLTSAALRFYVALGLLPQPHIQRKGRGTKVWYPQEVIGLLTVINRMKRRGMKLKEIAGLIGQREVLEEDQARATASSPMLSDDMETIICLGEQLRSRRPDQELVTAVYDTEEREGQLFMVPVKVVYVPKSG